MCGLGPMQTIQNKFHLFFNCMNLVEMLSTQMVSVFNLCTYIIYYMAIMPLPIHPTVKIAHGRNYK